MTVSKSATEADAVAPAVVVTGATSGVGRALAVDLVSRGVGVVAAARSISNLADLAAETSRSPGRLTTVPCDVTNSSDVDRLVSISTGLGPVAGVVTCAGVFGPAGPVARTDPADWWSAMTTNVFGTFNVARGFLPSLISSGCASRIVMIGSQFGIRCSPGATAYSCSKAALFRLGESMAAELKATPVRVFVVAPGPVRTPLTEWPEELYLSQPELRSRQWVKPDRFTALVAQILTGDWDEFSGRYIHALEDLSALRARQNDILTQDLRTLRMTL